MDANRLKEILEKTSRRILDCAELFFKFDLNRLCEAEARHILTKILDEEGIFYRIETPTKEVFRIKGLKNPRRALVDLVIEEHAEGKIKKVLVELKRGQSDSSNIKKDFEKMIKEKREYFIGKEPSLIEGGCFFHILPDHDNERANENQKSKIAALQKYKEGYEGQWPNEECNKKWFLLFILDCNSKSYFSFVADNICELNRGPRRIVENTGLEWIKVRKFNNRSEGD